MKKIIYFFLIANFALIREDCFSQWVLQTSGVATELRDVHFINENTGWACGRNGVILKTTNSGTNWMQQTSGTFNMLEGIHAVDANILYAVGWFQTILKSTNGGTNWIAIRNGTTNTVPSFLKCFFLNANTGWLLRTSGWILRTTDGGANFDSSQVTNGYIYDIYFKDALTGVLCGAAAFVAKSTDGGVTWVQVQLPLFQFQAPNLYRLSFVGNNGWTIGEGGTVNMGRLVYRTTDFGSTWDSIGRVPYPLNELNYSVFFTNINTGYAGGTTGYIFKSTNGGFNWIQQNVPINGYRGDFWFANDSLGWVVGGGGYILKTTNGGTYVKVQNITEEIPVKHSLKSIYPNPFNPVANIEFEIGYTDDVEITVYDIQGRLIKVLVSEKLNPGRYKTTFNGENLSSGIYMCILTTTMVKLTKAMVLIK